MRRGRILIAIVIALISIGGYLGTRSVNPVTGESQHIALTPQQEIALGLQSAPQMAEEFGGLDPDQDVQAFVREVGNRLVQSSVASNTEYRFQFNVLADAQTVNAFALPGGPIFITHALLERFENEAQLAGVLGHEISHVIARHSAEHIAKGQLAQGLINAVGLAGSDDASSGQNAARAAAVVAQMVQLKYGRSDEYEADTLGVRLMAEARYDPRAMIEVMRILKSASGGGGQPEFMSSHPDPGNREQLIREAIERRFPNGIPPDFTLGQNFGRGLP